MSVGFTGSARINYLSTLDFGQDLLDQIATAADGVEVLQIPAQHVDDIGPDVWAQVDVLHTSSVVCHPAAAPRLRWVQLDTSGVDHLRSHPIWAADVAITTIGGISPVPLAEYVMWSILGVAHRLPELLRVRDSHAWPDPADRWRRLLPAPVRGSTVGVIGYGRIGREIGRLASAFGMTVLGVTRTADRPEQPTSELFDFAASSGAAVVELFGPNRLHEVLRRSDYLVVVVPLTSETANMIDAAALAELKDQAAVINVARGGIVNEGALAAELHSGRICAAVLDVFDSEPLAPTDPWWEEPTVFVTPHVSGLAPAYASQVATIVEENMRRFSSGEPLMNRVDRARGY